ncbi:Transposon Tf2-6 polyprotein, partial [Nosema granulosis]
TVTKPNKPLIYKKNISVLENYFKTNKVPVIQDILNSIATEKKVSIKESTEKKLENGEKNEEITFKIIDESLGVEMKKNLKIIREVRFMEEEVLNNWLEDFEELSKFKKWNIKQQYQALELLVKDPLVNSIFTLESFDQIKNVIRRQILRKTDSNLIHSKLTKIKQGEYVYIREYLGEIKKLVDQYAAFESISKIEYNRKLKECFYHGLGFNTRIRVAEKTNGALEEILDYLEKIEDNLILEIEKFKNQSKKSIVNDKYDFINNKWCSHCKNNTHTTKTCYFLNREREKNSDRSNRNKFKEEKSCIMVEKKAKTLELRIKGKIKEEEVNIMIDTGASRNFIDKKLVEKINLNEFETEPLEILTANGGYVKLTKKTTLSLTICGLERKFTVDFYILDKCVEEVIIGNEFIFNNNAILDFNRNVLKIQDEEVRILKENSILEEDLDRMFFEKLGLIKSEDNESKQEVVRKIQEYKVINNSFTNMKIEPVKLKTSTEKIELSRKKSYIVPNKYLQKAQEELTRLCKEGIIVESEVCYVSPAFFIEKKNLDLRLVIDYRNLNQYIIDECYDIPKIFENLMMMGTNEYYTTIDLKNGFNQIPIEEKSQELTGFMIMNKTYKYVRVPFGIRSGPKIFQKTISRILEGIENCFVYIDDIIIFNKTLEEHNKVILRVLERLKLHEVKINFEKSSFYNREIKLLGYLVSKQGIQADKKYLQNITLNSVPKTKRQVQKIIGIINWYRRFLKNISEKLSPITDLLKGEKFVWKNLHTEIINDIKKEINESSRLKFPNFKKKFILETDASKLGIGAVLYQEDGVIGYFSKKLNSTEQNYSIVEKELFAMVKALMFFKDIVQGYFIEIYTDNRNCVLENNKFTSRIERWKILLNDFNFEIKSIKGEKNNIADALSRNCLITEVKRNTLKEKFIEKVQDCMIDGMKLDTGSEKIKLKQNKEEEFLFFVHEISGHAGIITNYYNLKDFFEIKNLLSKLTKITNECELCIKGKHYNKKIVNKCVLTAKNPFERVSTDIFGPFNLDEYNHEKSSESGYFITLTDIYTRITWVKFVLNITAEDLIKTVKEWIIRFKKPEIMIMDNGVQYTSKKFKEFLGKMNIECRYIPKYTPSSNGVSERLNIAISEVLRMNKGKSISQVVKVIRHKLNENHHTTIHCTPRALLTGEHFYDPRCKKRIFTRKCVNNENQLIKIAPGEKVYLKNMIGNKLDDKFLGPYTILESGKKGLWYKLDNNEWVHLKNLKY